MGTRGHQILGAGEGARAFAPPGATLPGFAVRKAFRNSRGHGLRTVVPWSVSAFLLDKASVGPRSSGGLSAHPFPRPGSTHTKAERAILLGRAPRAATGETITCRRGLHRKSVWVFPEGFEFS